MKMTGACIVLIQKAMVSNQKGMNTYVSQSVNAGEYMRRRTEKIENVTIPGTERTGFSGQPKKQDYRVDFSYT